MKATHTWQIRLDFPTKGAPKSDMRKVSTSGSGTGMIALPNISSAPIIAIFRAFIQF